MRATEDCLFLQPQVLITYRAWLLLIEPLESLFLDIPPLILAKGQLRLVNQSESLGETQLLNVVYSLLLYVMISDLIPLSIVFKHLGDGGVLMRWVLGEIFIGHCGGPGGAVLGLFLLLV